MALKKTVVEFGELVGVRRDTASKAFVGTVTGGLLYVGGGFFVVVEGDCVG